MHRVALVVIACAMVFTVPRTEGLQAKRPAQTGSIAGVTIDATTDQPVAGVAVYLSTQATSQQTTSDANGRFTFSGVPTGNCWLQVRLPGWAQAESQSEHPEEYEGAHLVPPPPSFSLAEGQRIDNVRLGLRKYATLAGRVIDEAGRPVDRATVSAMPYRAVAGRKMLVSGPDTKTDENGAYRFTSLLAGEYVLTASMDYTRIREIGAAPGRELFVFQRRFHPDATGTTSARTTSANWGQILGPIDFTLRKGPAVRITGQVTGASSFREKAFVHLEWTEPVAREDHLFVANSYLDSRGNFSMAPVPPGRYVLTTYGAQSAARRMLWTNQPVTVGSADIASLRVPVREGLRVTGRANFDGTLPRPTADEMARIYVVLTEPHDFGGSDVMPPHTKVRPDGTFTSAETAAGRYLVSAWGEPKGWTLRSAIVAGKDASATPIDLMNDLPGAVLTFTDRAPRLHGRVGDDREQPPARAHVLVFPSAEPLWTDFGHARRLRWVTIGRDGAYEFRDLPAGDYFVVAVASVPRSGWRDESLLKVLAKSAARVSLAEGKEVSQPLRLLSVPSVK